MSRFAICGLSGYNKSDAANCEPQAARRKTPMCLQYRDLRRSTKKAGRFLEMKKLFILRRRRRLRGSAANRKPRHCNRIIKQLYDRAPEGAQKFWNLRLRLAAFRFKIVKYK